MASVKVEVIREPSALERLRPDWEAAYDRDPHATVFSSFAWLRGWLEATSNPWWVLAARPAAGAPCEAFLALGLKGSGGRFRRHVTLYLAGHPISNRTGLVCAAGREDATIAAFAAALRPLPWRTASLELVADPRALALMGRLSGARAVPEPDSDSPYLALPERLDDYLAAQFPGKAGRELRRRERNVAGRGLRATQATPATLGAHLDAFLSVHAQRFGAVQPRHERMYRLIFARMIAVNALHFEVLWDGGEEGRPVAAQVGFLDAKHRVYHGCQGGWDARYAELAPGLLLKLSAIRYAHARGYRGVDFGRGADAYKYALGAVPAPTQRVRWQRRGFPPWLPTVRALLAARSSG
jgi:CelD/BcsL family acetyltransferase involved in cellulose biosynthesis